MKSLISLFPLALTIAACGSTDAPEAAPESATPDGAAEATPSVEPASSPATATVTTPAASQAAATPPRDPIRGPGGLEEKCLQRVAQETGATVNGTNRIAEAESGIAIFVNVEGATAPWRCFGYRDGTIDSVMFAGDEGAL